MAKRDPSSEFARLLSQLQQSPESVALKQAIVLRLPEMKALAQNNHPLALYWLAQSYCASSPQYKEMMFRSADLGCTNAMLAACQLLFKSNQRADVGKAAEYMKSIEASNDSYIKNAAQELLMKLPQRTQLSTKSLSNRFFTICSESTEKYMGDSKVSMLS